LDQIDGIHGRDIDWVKIKYMLVGERTETGRRENEENSEEKIAR